MTEEKKQSQKNSLKKNTNSPKGAGGQSVYAKKRAEKSRRTFKKRERPVDEFEQQIVDLARVTRVMAGGKRMRFRACVAVGNKKGKIGLGLAKGADVSIAVNKAVTDAKKKMIDVFTVNNTIAHEIFWKKGAAKIILKPARKGRGVIAGGAIRVILELAGIQNITSKNLGTNNKVNIAKCTIDALNNLKKIENVKGAKENKKEGEKSKDEKTVKKTQEKISIQDKK
ncbi:30S ribosomal protein S5 [Candidatus Parcubacteria bacterium]|nr:30S ribosomal protein S5 [Candidatus Parcubacteria bacterium]